MDAVAEQDKVSKLYLNTRIELSHGDFRFLGGGLSREKISPPPIPTKQRNVFNTTQLKNQIKLTI